MSYKTKKEGIIDIVKELNEWTKVRDIAETFEKRTRMSVSPQRVHQVVEELNEEGKVKVKQEELGGNKVNFVKPKGELSDESD